VVVASHLRFSSMSSFRRNITPAFRREIDASKRAANARTEFAHLERAHVLGQASTALHVAAHLRMAAWSLRERDLKELRGQLLRVVGAATKTAIGWVPSGNTGGVNVSPFKSLPTAPDLAAEIESARNAS
jgi:Protein of unknown function (DUF3703)